MTLYFVCFVLRGHQKQNHPKPGHVAEQQLFDIFNMSHDEDDDDVSLSNTLRTNNSNVSLSILKCVYLCVCNSNGVTNG